MTEPLIHKNPDAADDALAKEAEEFLKKSTTLQAMAQILAKQREILLHAAEEDPKRELGWLTRAEYRKTFPAIMRMEAFASRADIRQRITTDLTGFRPNAAYKLGAKPQSELIDSVIDDGDINLSEFESAFNPNELVVYMDVSIFWNHFMNESLARIIEENTPREKEFFTFLLNVFLQKRNPLKPILTHLDVRRAIDGTTWQKRVPLEKRVAVDAARLKQENTSSSRAFSAEQELGIVTIEDLVACMDLTDLVPILRVAGEKMGFQANPSEAGPELILSDEELEELHSLDTSTEIEGDEKKG